MHRYSVSLAIKEAHPNASPSPPCTNTTGAPDGFPHSSMRTRSRGASTSMKRSTMFRRYSRHNSRSASRAAVTDGSVGVIICSRSYRVNSLVWLTNGRPNSVTQYAGGGCSVARRRAVFNLSASATNIVTCRRTGDAKHAGYTELDSANTPAGGAAYRAQRRPTIGPT